MSEERTEQEKEFGKEKEKKTKWRGGGRCSCATFQSNAWLLPIKTHLGFRARRGICGFGINSGVTQRFRKKMVCSLYVYKEKGKGKKKKRKRKEGFTFAEA